MIDIKFMVWDKILKEMNFACRIDFCGISDFGSPNVSVKMKNSPTIRTSRLEDVILRRFTGLKDKNGKEIYEGDIIDTKDDFPETRYLPVVWYKCRWILKDAEVPDLDEWVDYKISGNIYENPDLIKNGKEKAK